jgi:hypothetical protein
MFAGDYNSAVGGNMAGNDFSAVPKLISGKPRVIKLIIVFYIISYYIVQRSLRIKH